MALHVQAAFAAGELDPAVRERSTLDKYQTGLATARNVLIAKSGRVINRAGRYVFVKTKLSDGSPVVLYSPPNTGIFIEVGGPGLSAPYVRGYNLSTGALLYDVTGPSFTNLSDLQFDSSKGFIYFACAGQVVSKMNFLTGDYDTSFLLTTNVPVYVNVTTDTGSGYTCDYVATAFTQQFGESEAPKAAGFTSAGIPSTTGQITKFTFKVFIAPGTVATDYTSMNFYRRPTSGTAYGYVGSAIVGTASGGYVSFTFSDVGQAADYTHAPPASAFPPVPGLVVPTTVNALSAFPNALVIYQQRLLLAAQAFDPELIVASRPGIYNNFDQNFPLDGSSALALTCGASGNPKILRMVESNGLVVFTTNGVFLSSGALGPSNLGFVNRAPYVIDGITAPIAAPGGVIFLDYSSNSVRQLIFSYEQQAYVGDELSIFSNHLFEGRRVISWAWQEGETPMLWCVFNDGKFATLVLNREQQQRAWTRHDSAFNINYVCNTGIQGKTLFVTQDSENNQYIECSFPRYPQLTARTISSQLAYVPTQELISPGTDINYSYPCMDAAKVFQNDLRLALAVGEVFTVAPVDGITWSGPLIVSCTATVLFSVGSVGKVLRYFNADGTYVDLTITHFNTQYNVTATPSETFPSTASVGPNLALCQSTFTGLDHLNGLYPLVIVDGEVVCSPNNDIENYPKVQVVGGSLTLPNGLYGAWVYIGLPVTNDTETLDIDTVEQRPIRIESKTVNKVYVKTYRSNGLYCASKFPSDNLVEGMEDIDEMVVDEDDADDITVNTYVKPNTRRHEVTLPGDWGSNGKVCLRQVDGMPFEILSIIPDVEDEQRG